MSVYTALRQLGFPCYHMFEVLENKANTTHLDFWRKVANGQPSAQYNWNQVFANYTAAVDNPACCVWRELLIAYPDAKVLEFVTPFGRKFGDMSRKLIWQRSHQGSMQDRDRAIAHYHQHIAAVRAALPADRLLVFSADQGWQPLCDFLGVPVPNTPFPNVNDRAAIKAVLLGMTRGAYVILAAGAVAVLSLAYGTFRYFS